jgi:hypothetical protein
MRAFKRQSTSLEDIRPVKVSPKKELTEHLIHEVQQVGIDEEVVDHLGDVLEVLAAALPVLVSQVCDLPIYYSSQVVNVWRHRKLALFIESGLIHARSLLLIFDGGHFEPTLVLGKTGHVGRMVNEKKLPD